MKAPGRWGTDGWLSFRRLSDIEERRAQDRRKRVVLRSATSVRGEGPEDVNPSNLLAIPSREGRGLGRFSFSVPAVSGSAGCSTSEGWISPEESRIP